MTFDEVQSVQVVQNIQAPTCFLPRVAGEDLRRGIERSEAVERLEQSVAIERLLFFFHLRLRQHAAHFGNRNHRQKADEQEQQRKEQAYGSDESRPIPKCR